MINSGARQVNSGYVNKLTMVLRRWVMHICAIAGMALGFWNAHVDAQQVNVGANVNVRLLDQYLIDTCARLRLAGGGQTSSSSSSSSSNSSSSSGPILTVAAAAPRTSAAAVSPAALTIGQSDLLTRCANIQAAAANGQSSALDQVTPGDFNAIKLDAILFADASDATLARLHDLRQARSGATANNLDLRYNNMQLLANDAPHRGGGASADNMVESSPWGIWGRINHAEGDKDATTLTGPLDLTHTDYTLGADYRTARSVFGMSVGLRKADIDFGTHGERGGLDTRTTTVSAYASSYLVGNLYVDGIVNYGLVSYDATRHIAYDEFGTPIDRTALGNTDGKTLSVGGSLGYDIAADAFTLTPSLAYFYIDAKVDPFAEHGAAGFNLAIAEQRYRSSSARLQLSSAYAISVRRTVISPYVRAALIKEFKDEVDTFGVRFVDDPDAAAGVPVTIEALDDNYYRVTLGVSAQLPRELATFLEYQVVSGFQNVNLWSATLGLRKQF
jgi:outer membrane autotransporter protein